MTLFNDSQSQMAAASAQSSRLARFGSTALLILQAGIGTAIISELATATPGHRFSQAAQACTRNRSATCEERRQVSP